MRNGKFRERALLIRKFLMSGHRRWKVGTWSIWRITTRRSWIYDSKCTGDKHEKIITIKTSGRIHSGRVWKNGPYLSPFYNVATPDIYTWLFHLHPSFFPTFISWKHRREFKKNKTKNSREFLSSIHFCFYV